MAVRLRRWSRKPQPETDPQSVVEGEATVAAAAVYLNKRQETTMEVVRQLLVAAGVFATVCLALFGLATLTLMSLMSIFASIERESEKQEDNWLSQQEESVEVWDFNA